MAELQDGAKDLAGFQSEQRMTSALEIWIDYKSQRYLHQMQPRGNDWLFSFSIPIGQPEFDAARPATLLDAYAIRREFEAADSPQKALRFLSEAGRFWPFESVLWSQFQEWQQFFESLRTDPDIAEKNPEGKRAWDAARGIMDTSLKNSFAAKSFEFTAARIQTDFTPDSLYSFAIGKSDIEDFGKIMLDDGRTIWALKRFALWPGGKENESRVSLGWYDSGSRLLDKSGVPLGCWSYANWTEQYGMAPKGRLEPFLRIEARNIIEAIAATIYADRAHGVKTGKCWHCGKLFKIDSDHRKPKGRMFCPAPPHLNSQPCKNAYHQKERRDKERKEKERKEKELAVSMNQECNA